MWPLLANTLLIPLPKFPRKSPHPSNDPRTYPSLLFAITMRKRLDRCSQAVFFMPNIYLRFSAVHNLRGIGKYAVYVLFLL